MMLEQQVVKLQQSLRVDRRITIANQQFEFALETFLWCDDKAWEAGAAKIAHDLDLGWRWDNWGGIAFFQKEQT